MSPASPDARSGDDRTRMTGNSEVMQLNPIKRSRASSGFPRQLQLVGCGVRAQRGMRERPQYELPEVGSILLRGSWALPKVGRVFLSPTACSLTERAVPRPSCLACSWVSNFKLDT